MNMCNSLQKPLKTFYCNIPHDTIICDERNPPRIYGKIKKFFLLKYRAFNAYFWDKDNTDRPNKF